MKLLRANLFWVIVVLGYTLWIIDYKFFMKSGIGIYDFVEMTVVVFLTAFFLKYSFNFIEKRKSKK